MCPILVMGIKDELVTIKFWVPIIFNSATTWQESNEIVTS